MKLLVNETCGVLDMLLMKNDVQGHSPSMNKV